MSLSHNATIGSRENPPNRHHYGQALSVSAFYATPMALRIRNLREDRGWTQEHLASLAGMSRSQLAMIERETRPANTLRLNAIASALGVQTEDLFETDEEVARVTAILRDLSPDDRAVLVRMAEALAAKGT